METIMETLGDKPLFGVISSGKKNMMYTLRIAYDVLNEHDKKVDTFFSYACNLSTEPLLAESKAHEICEKIGIQLRSTADFPLIPLIEITETGAARKERERQEMMEKREAEFEEQYKDVELLDCFVQGQYIDQKVADVGKIDYDYVHWLSRGTVAAPTPFGMNIRLAKRYIELNPPTSVYVGVLEHPIELELTIKSRFDVESMYGWRTMVRCADSDGNVIVFYTNSKKILEHDDGTTLRIQAIVSKQSEYRGIKNTTLKKPKIMKEKV